MHRCPVERAHPQPHADHSGRQRFVGLTDHEVARGEGDRCVFAAPHQFATDRPHYARRSVSQGDGAHDCQHDHPEDDRDRCVAARLRVFRDETEHGSGQMPHLIGKAFVSEALSETERTLACAEGPPHRVPRLRPKCSPEKGFSRPAGISSDYGMATSSLDDVSDSLRPSATAQSRPPWNLNVTSLAIRRRHSLIVPIRSPFVLWRFVDGSVGVGRSSRRWRRIGNRLVRVTA